MEGGQLAAYDLQDKLGSGGMGTVYRALDRRIGRTVAIKIIRPDNLANEKARERFAREARSIGALNHPNIATLHDVSLSGEAPFLVMEYLSGGSLTRRIGQGRLELPEMLRWAIQVAAGLEHAHSHGVIHRDLKPANIMFSADGTPKIIDFGLALMPESSELTPAGVMVGTAEYMSPEQACGKTVDLRSDMFSFGVILYHMAAGNNPFSCDSIPATLHSIVYDPVPPIETVRPDLPVSLARLVSSLLEKNPEDRPKSLTSVVNELRLAQTSLDSAATETMTVAQASERKPPARRRPRILTVALLASIISVAAAGWWLRGRPLHPGLPPSRQLVVLPFDSLSHDPSEQALCDGVVELLTSSLSQVERFHNTLWVIPSADVRRMQLHDVSGARKALPVVNLAVTGSLQDDGGQILVTVNLSDVATMRQIASRVIPLSAGDRTQLLRLLTAALLDMLDLNTGEENGALLQEAQARVPSAYDSYLQGKGFLQHYEVPANVNRAIDALEQSVRLDPTFAMAQATLADAYLRRYASTKDKEWLARADQSVHQSLDLDGKQAYVHLVLGRLYSMTGQFDQAISEYRQVISREPTNVSAYNYLAVVYADAGRTTDAEGSYLQAIRIRPGYWQAYFDLGAFYELRGEYAKALDQLSLGVKLAPEYPEGHNTLGSAFYYVGRFDDALKEFNRALVLRPTALTFSNRGDIYRLRGNYKSALEDYESGLKLDGSSPLIWGSLAETEGQLSATDKARDDFKHAIALSREQLAVNPRNVNLLAEMGYFLAKMSDCAEARESIGQARKLANDRIDVIFLSAKVAEACHNRESAVSFLALAIQKGYLLPEIEADPDLSELRQTPAYAAIRKK